MTEVRMEIEWNHEPNSDLYLGVVHATIFEKIEGHNRWKRVIHFCESDTPLRLTVHDCYFHNEPSWTEFWVATHDAEDHAEIVEFRRIHHADRALMVEDMKDLLRLQAQVWILANREMLEKRKNAKIEIETQGGDSMTDMLKNLAEDLRNKNMRVATINTDDLFRHSRAKKIDPDDVQ